MALAGDPLEPRFKTSAGTAQVGNILYDGVVKAAPFFWPAAEQCRHRALACRSQNRSARPIAAARSSERPLARCASRSCSNSTAAAGRIRCLISCSSDGARSAPIASRGARCRRSVSRRCAKERYPPSELSLVAHRTCSSRFRTRASASPSSESGPAQTSAAMTSAAASAALAASGRAARCSASTRPQSRMPRLVRSDATRNSASPESRHRRASTKLPWRACSRPR